MPKVSPIQSNFGAGEISPYSAGRVDMDRYKAALTTCLNYIPTIQGGLTRRPGTQFIDYVKDDSRKVRLVRFEFSTTQAYVLEFGHNYVRFFRNHGMILDPISSDPYEVATPFTEAELFEINFTQSADVLFIVHPSHKPKKLMRRGNTDWLLVDVEFNDGPYLTTNTSATTLAPSAATGTSVTLTAGPSRTITNAVNDGGRIKITAVGHKYVTGDKVLIASVGGVSAANGERTIVVVDDDNFILEGSTFSGSYTSGGTSVPAPFASTDIGRHIRMQEGQVWGLGIITGFTNGSQVTIEVLSTLTNTNAKKNWRLGVFSGTTGWPSVVVFHEDRLFFAGCVNSPQRLDGSQSGDYENFAPTELDGTVKSNNAVSFSLNSNDVNVIRWMVSDEKGMLVGSVGGEWVVRSASASEALSPTSISAKRATSYGSANIAPVQAGKAAIFVQRAGRKLREFNYFFDVDGFRATDLSVLSEHITLSGLLQLAFQKEPQSLIWCVREDGMLACMTYDRDVDNLRLAWHRHQLGGNSNAGGHHSAVESIACIPAPDGTRDELWMSVRRYIDGQVVRTVEVMTKLFEDDDDQKEAFFLDCGLTYDDPWYIDYATQTSPIEIGVTGHGLSNGDKVRLSDIQGMTELNNKIFTIQNVTTDSFELVGTDGTNYKPYVGDGYSRKMISMVSGLQHLEGEEISILADGAVLPKQVVTSGTVQLPNPAATIHFGLGYNSDAQLPRLEAGAADGTALGKTRRTHRVGFLFHRSLNLLIGMDFKDMSRITFRTSSDQMNHAPKLYSGIMSETISADYDFENQIAWRQDQPLPSTILAVLPQMVTQDRG